MGLEFAMQNNDTALPISEVGEQPAGGSTITVENIRIMVERFYERTRGDDLLGPIFNDKVSDWEAHYEKMTRFWSSATMRAGTYAGRPIEAHKFEEQGLLTDAHFVRWVREFTGVVRDVFSKQDAEVFIELGRRMAVSISTRLGVRGVERQLASGH
jgi:hemoglobin